MSSPDSQGHSIELSRKSRTNHKASFLLSSASDGRLVLGFRRIKPTNMTAVSKVIIEAFEGQEEVSSPVAADKANQVTAYVACMFRNEISVPLPTGIPFASF
jgi:hypothetical protein